MGEYVAVDQASSQQLDLDKQDVHTVETVGIARCGELLLYLGAGNVGQRIINGKYDALLR